MHTVQPLDLRPSCWAVEALLGNSQPLGGSLRPQKDARAMPASSLEDRAKMLGPATPNEAARIMDRHAAQLAQWKASAPQRQAEQEEQNRKDDEFEKSRKEGNAKMWDLQIQIAERARQPQYDAADIRRQLYVVYTEDRDVRLARRKEDLERKGGRYFCEEALNVDAFNAAHNLLIAYNSAGVKPAANIEHWDAVGFKSYVRPASLYDDKFVGNVEVERDIALEEIKGNIATIMFRLDELEASRDQNGQLQLDEDFGFALYEIQSNILYFKGENGEGIVRGVPALGDVYTLIQQLEERKDVLMKAYKYAKSSILSKCAQNISECWDRFVNWFEYRMTYWWTPPPPQQE